MSLTNIRKCHTSQQVEKSPFISALNSPISFSKELGSNLTFEPVSRFAFEAFSKLDEQILPIKNIFRFKNFNTHIKEPIKFIITSRHSKWIKLINISLDWDTILEPLVQFLVFFCSYFYQAWNSNLQKINLKPINTE